MEFISVVCSLTLKGMKETYVTKNSKEPTHESQKFTQDSILKIFKDQESSLKLSFVRRVCDNLLLRGEVLI